MIQKFSFDLPARLRFGCGVLDELAKQALPGKRLFILTGGNSIKRFGTLNRVLEMVRPKAEYIIVRDDVQPNPTADYVDQMTLLGQEAGIDCVIGLGGGSSMDAAKAVAAMIPNPGKLWDYVSVGSGGKQPFMNQGCPLIAIPTTAGTGSEGNKTAVITKTQTGEKIGVRTFFPYQAYIDPELTLTVPPRLTALQGYDALCHCIEAFTCVKANPMGDAWALRGIAEIFENLPKVVKNRQDCEARTAVSFSAMLGGIVLSLPSSTTAHSIGHMLSGLNPRIEHGASLAMISPAFHRTIATHEPNRYAQIADYIGLNSANSTDSAKAFAFLDTLDNLMEDCGISDMHLSDYGFSTTDLDSMLRNTYIIAGGKLSKDRYLLSEDELTNLLLSCI